MPVVKFIILSSFLFTSCINTSNHSEELIIGLNNRTKIDSLNFKLSIIAGELSVRDDVYLVKLEPVSGGSNYLFGVKVKDVNGYDYKRIVLSQGQDKKIELSYTDLSKFNFYLDEDSLKVYDISHLIE